MKRTAGQAAAAEIAGVDIFSLISNIQSVLFRLSCFEAGILRGFPDVLGLFGP